MLKFMIYYNGKYSDQIVIEGETLKEVRENVYMECEKRNWDTCDCWSEELTPN